MRSSSSRKKTRVLILFSILILVFVCANFFQKEVKAFFYSVSSPFQKVLWKVGDNCSNFLTSVIWVNTLRKEKDDYCQKNNELLAEIEQLKELKKENESLKSALGIELHKEFELAEAHIISKDVSQDYIMIDKGSSGGIKKDMPVITAQKVLVGKIVEVFDNYSRVVLISNKESSFDAHIKEKNISGIIKGKGNMEVFFDLIPQDKEVLENDVIVSSNLSGFFPPNLLVGQASGVKRNDVESFQQSGVNLAFNIKDIDYLFIIINSR